MPTKTITLTYPESTSRSQSQTINLQDLGEPITLSPNTGTATYSISGRDLTVYVNNGTAVRTSTEYKYDASGYIESQYPSDFTATYPYNDGTYVGNIPKSGGYYSIGTFPGGTGYHSGDYSATLTWRFKWSGSSWSFDDGWVTPATQSYSDAQGYTGTLDYQSWNGSTPAYPPTSAGTGQPAGYTTTRSVSGTATYGGNIAQPPQTYYRQDYYGTAVRNVNWYAYTVSVTYTQVFRRPSDFAWSTSKYSGGNPPTASEWNELTERIQDFRTYKGLPEVSYIVGYSGNPLTATMFNQAVTRISSLSPPISPPSTKSTGDTLYAWELNALRDSLNSVT